jgi:hypothetical protein
MVLVDGAGVPLGVHLSAANLAECQLAEATLAEVAKPQRQKLQRIIADRAYDSRDLHDRMAKQGIELLAPHLSNRKNRCFAAIVGVGSSNEPTPGSLISAASSSATNATSRPTAPSST